ncbi:hypothetical protein V8F20_005818 [Naviculisporaceae sp. PSN 640]
MTRRMYLLPLFVFLAWHGQVCGYHKPQKNGGEAALWRVSGKLYDCEYYFHFYQKIGAGMGRIMGLLFRRSFLSFVLLGRLPRVPFWQEFGRVGLLLLRTCL